MATNPRYIRADSGAPMNDAKVKATRRQVTNLMRHPSQHPNRRQHPSQGAVIHYALDLEDPPVLACDTPVTGAIYSPTASEVTCPDCMRTEHFPRRVGTAADITEAPTITANNVLIEAAMLLSDEGDNPEYDRAILELTSALIGAGPDDSMLMTRILRALKEA